MHRTGWFFGTVAAALAVSGCCNDSVGGASYGLSQQRGGLSQVVALRWGASITLDPGDNIEVASDATPPADLLVLFDSAREPVAFEPAIRHSDGDVDGCPHEEAIFAFGVPDGDYTVVYFADQNPAFAPNNCDVTPGGAGCARVMFDGREALVLSVTVLTGAGFSER